MNYNKNKELIYDKLDKLKTHPTAQELLLELKKDYPKIGIATIYRNLNLLVEEGRVIKIPVPGGKDKFDATISEHYHARCVKCDDVIDVDIDIDAKVKGKIKPIGIEVTINHICDSCRH